MKRFISYVFTALLSANAVAEPVDEAKARAIALDYLVPGNAMTLVKTAECCEARARGAVSPTLSTPPYYIYSRGADKGFVIVSGDDCLPRIIGFTEQGDWNEETVPDALREMLQYYSDVVADAQANGTNTPNEYEARRRAATSTKVNIAPFVTSHWHQSSPYNDKCPTITSNGNRALTGCVATAASQILYYWRRDLPRTLQATTPTYGYGDAPVKNSVPKGTPMKWELMLDNYGGGEPAEYKDAVSEFVFATGAATWLTYGASTAGNIEKIPNTFSAYFGMNGGTVHYRDSYAQAAWTNLLYNELLAGRPVMYTGVHPSNGGHAVFIHGFRANDELFYFNFGWGAGNGYDGYYTTDQSKGMNGFNGSQSALVGAYPKKWNLDTKLEAPLHVYVNSSNRVKFTITNNSTLPFSGVYFFASTSKAKPAKLTDARFSDDKTVVGLSETRTFHMEAKPTSAKTWYLTVTDAKLNVIQQIAVDAEEAKTDMVVNDMYIDGSSEVENHGGQDYSVIYNSSKMSFVLDVTNRSSVSYDGNLRYTLFSSSDGGQTWDSGVTRTVSVELKGAATTKQPITVSSLNTGKLYKVQLTKSVSSLLVNYDLTCAEGADSIVFFTLREGNMVVNGYENRVVKCSGHWDLSTFSGVYVVTSTKYKDHTAFDLTDVEGVTVVPQSTVNPNAVTYVSESSNATGVNVIRGDKCDYLSLVMGYDFTLNRDVVASKAELKIVGEPAMWHIVTSPFRATVPRGIVARRIDSHKSIGISNQTTDVDVMEAGQTYLVMCTSADNMKVYGTDVMVKASPVAGADSAMIGTYVNTVTPEGAFVLNEDEAQYFVPVDAGVAVDALGGYFLASDVKSKFRAYSSITVDPQYQVLARNIETAYNILEYNKDKAADGAYETFLKAIHDAELLFSDRGDESVSVSVLKSRAQELLDLAGVYERNVSPLVKCEADFTPCIQNPSFEASTTSAKGWTLGASKSGTASTMIAKVYASTNATYLTAEADGSNILCNRYVYTDADTKEKDTLSVGISQVVKGLLPGYYRMSVKVATDGGNKVTVFAGDSTVTVSSSPYGVHYFSQAVIDNVIVRATEGSETGELTIGIKEGDWYKADDFRLTYTGSLLTDEEITGIDTVEGEVNKLSISGIYTLQGVKVAKPDASGMYIIDGKKVFIK